MARPGWTAIAVFNVPKGMLFRLDRVGVDYDVEQGTTPGMVEYCVTVNDQPIGLGFGSFRYIIGALNFRDMIVVGQSVQGPAIVEICAQNHDIVDRTAWGRMFGYLGPNL